MSKPDFRKYIRNFWILIGSSILLLILLLFSTSMGLFGPIPTFEELENPNNKLATEVFSSDGVLIGKYYFENRSITPFEEIPDYVDKALVATEDIRFYEHSGIDYWGTIRAVFKTFTGDKQGASTLTQQLAKQLLGRKTDGSLVTTLASKLKEWVLAIKLERRYTKNEIVNLYLNTVPFSENSFGISSAARTYFNKAPKELTVEEGATLVGMLKGSTLYNPKRNPENARLRRNTVIDQMTKYKFLNKSVSDSIKNLPLVVHYVSPSHNEGLATYFREELRMQMLSWCKDHKNPETGEPYNLYRDGLKIYTTINSKMQQYAEEAVKEHMTELQNQLFKTYGKSTPWGNDETFIEKSMKVSDRWRSLKKEGISEDSIIKNFKTPIAMTVFGWKGEIDTVMSPYDSIKYSKMFLHSGMMAVDPQTGYVLAWVGGIDHRFFQYDHVNKNATRQVGSTIKPFLYTAAIENGWSPCYQLENEKQCIGDWCPDNSDGKYGGTFPLYTGLARSLNTFSVALIRQMGVATMIDMCRRLGITSKIPSDATICLGTPDISLYEMVGAYATFANKGVYIKPNYLTRIEDSKGTVIEEFHPEQHEAISEQVAYVMTRMLRKVVQEGTAQRLIGTYKIDGDVCGKTGTTQNNTDGWFMGITPQIVAGVWTGGSDRIIRFRSTFFGQGANMALPTFALFLNKCYADKSLGISRDATFEPPTDDLGIEIDCDQYQQPDTGNHDVIYGDEFNK